MMSPARVTAAYRPLERRDLPGSRLAEAQADHLVVEENFVRLAVVEPAPSFAFLLREGMLVR